MICLRVLCWNPHTHTHTKQNFSLLIVEFARLSKINCTTLWLDDDFSMMMAWECRWNWMYYYGSDWVQIKKHSSVGFCWFWIWTFNGSTIDLLVVGKSPINEWIKKYFEFLTWFDVVNVCRCVSVCTDYSVHLCCIFVANESGNRQEPQPTMKPYKRCEMIWYFFNCFHFQHLNGFKISNCRP